MKIQTMLSFACLSALTLAVAGCGSDPEPIVTETPSPRVSVTAEASPSATPSPSDDGELSDEELAELLPEEAVLQDIRGAIAVAERYVELLGKIFVDPDFSEWQALATPECEYCAAQVENTEDFYDQGWTAEGGEVTIAEGPVQANIADDGYAYVEIEADFDTVYAIGPDGQREVSEEASKKAMYLQLEYGERFWKVRGVQYEVLD